MIGMEGFPIIILLLCSSALCLNTLKPEQEFESEFARLASSPALVDRTLLARAFFAETTSRVLVRAPPRAGKTVNLQMLRAFLQAEVDREGRPLPINATRNYRLFQDNALNICQPTEFFREHFGRYPVIFVEGRRFNGTRSYPDVLATYREILRDIYHDHRYLLRNPGLWTDPMEVDHFNDFILKSRRVKLYPPVILKALTYLSELLHTHFRRKVIVLFDDHDAFLDSLEFKYNPDTDKITKFIAKFNAALLRANKFVGRALVTGAYRKPDVKGVLPVNTASYISLDDRPICKFFNFQF